MLRAELSLVVITRSERRSLRAVLMTAPFVLADDIDHTGLTVGRAELRTFPDFTVRRLLHASLLLAGRDVVAEAHHAVRSVGKAALRRYAPGHAVGRSFPTIWGVAQLADAVDHVVFRVGPTEFRPSRPSDAQRWRFHATIVKASLR